MDPRVLVTRVADGMYRVEHAGRSEILYVAGATADRWVFWNGRVFRGDWRAAEPQPPRAARTTGAQSLTAPMPARVIALLVEAGASVKKGDTVIVLEAMKMELPVRAPADSTVLAVHCREGQLVDADAVLVELG